MRSTALFTVAALATSLLSAQSTHYVDTSTWNALSDAVFAAAPGDEIVLAPGNYPAPFVTKTITIRAEAPGSVSVNGLVGLFCNLAPTDKVRLVGLDLDRLGILNGSVSLEDCDVTLNGIDATATTLHMTRCTVRETQPVFAQYGALRCADSVVSLAHCELTGSSPTIGGGGSPAIQLDNCTLLGNNLVLTADATAAFPAHVIRFVSPSTVRLADSVLTCAEGLCPIPSPDATCDRCTLSAPCTLVPDATLAMAATSALQAGDPWTVEMHGAPFSLVLVLASYDVGKLEVPELNAPLLLEPSQLFVAGAVITDQLGLGSCTWALPSAPLPIGAGIWVQSVAFDAAPLKVSPVEGGVVRP